MYIIVIILFALWILFLKNDISKLNSKIQLLEKKISSLTNNIWNLNNTVKNLSTTEQTPQCSFLQPSPQQNDEQNQNPNKHNDEYCDDEYYDDEYYDEDEFEDNNKNYVQHKEIKYSVQDCSKSSDTSLEKLFLGNIFNIIGAIAIIISCGLFITFVTSPLIKTIICLIIGVAMIISGCSMKDNNLKRYSEILTGTGFAVLFITVFCTTVMFNIFSQGACIFLGTLIMMGAFLAAENQKTISMIVIALLGGYSNLFIAASYSDINFLSGYFIFLNIISIIYTYRNPDKYYINILNLILTIIMGISCYSEVKDLNIIYPIIFWALYIAYDILSRMKNLISIESSNSITFLNFGLISAFSIIIFTDMKPYIGLLLLGAGIVYAIIIYYFINKESKNYKSFVYSLILTIFLSSYFLFNDMGRIIAWSAETVFLSFLINKYKYNYLLNWIMLFVSFSVIGIFMVKNVLYFDETTYNALFNMRSAAFLPVILSSYLSYLLIKNNDDPAADNIINFTKFIFISMIYLFAGLEINNAISVYTNSNPSNMFLQLMTLPVVGLIYSIQMSKIGQITKNPLYGLAGYFVYAAAIIVLLIFGYDYYDEASFIPVFNIRFAAFAAAIIITLMHSKIDVINAQVFQYIASILGFYLITAETFNQVGDFEYMVTINWLLYTGILLIAGIFKDIKVLKNIGIIFSIITIIKIFAFDLSDVELIYKLIIFTALGIIFMNISYWYNKRNGND